MRSPGKLVEPEGDDGFLRHLWLVSGAGEGGCWWEGAAAPQIKGRLGQRQSPRLPPHLTVLNVSSQSCKERLTSKVPT